MYSREDGTPAAKFENQIHGMTKKKRYNIIMKLQQEVSERKMKDKIGNVYEVLVEDISDSGEYYIGRSYMDSPDTDGVIFVKNDGSNIINKFVKCKVIGYDKYDLFAELY